MFLTLNTELQHMLYFPSSGLTLGMNSRFTAVLHQLASMKLCFCETANTSLFHFKRLICSPLGLLLQIKIQYAAQFHSYTHEIHLLDLTSH